MGTLAQLIDNTKKALTARIGAVLVLRKYGTAESSDEIETAVQGPNGGLAVEGTVALDPTDLSTLATSALQATLTALVTTPTIPAQITASDATDTSTITAKGLLVETAGDLAVRGTGAPSTTVTITVVAGQYVPIHCSRIMAASTATCVGLS